MRNADHRWPGFRVRRHAVAALAGTLAGTMACFGAAHAAETRSFVVDWFYDANYYGGDGDCPHGLNPSAIDFYRRDLARAGYSHQEIEDALKDFPGEGGLKQPWVPMVITRGNRKDNVYIYPTTEPDPGMLPYEGKYAYGFNLDGKGAASPNGFEEPETHEKGVDNQLFRAMGCIRSYRGLPPPGRPDLPEIHWDVMRNLVPAWLITVTAGDSLSKDGPVTVTIDHALERITRGAGGDVQRDMTYHVDSDPRSHNVLRGTIHDGRITTDQTDLVRIISDPYIVPEFQFYRARVRLDLKPDGSLKGVIGGYHPWYPIWYGLASAGYIKEYAGSVDVPALYYALKRHADWDPDPQTGENRMISSAFMIEAQPAFVVREPQAPVRLSTAAGARP